MKVESYEKEAIRILCGNEVPNSTLHQAMTNPSKLSCRFTGAGYYLDIEHIDLPEHRILCDKPTVAGEYQSREVGFIAFIENRSICLECYGYSANGVPESIRDGVVNIHTVDE